MRHLTIDTRVRPGRVAVLVDINDAQWESTCLRIIEYFTRLWGGCGNIIIPTDGESIAPLFWSILDSFDPDYLHAYGRTWRDIEIEDPAKFEKVYQNEIKAWEQQIGEKSGPHDAGTIRTSIRHSRLSKFAVSKKLQDELRDRLAPFYLEQRTVEAGDLGAASVPRHPHTDVIDILPHVEHPHRVLRIVKEAPFTPLWWASSFGYVNTELQAQLEMMNINVDDRGRSEDDAKLLICLAVKGYEAIESARFTTNTSLTAVQEILQSAPMRLSMAGLGYYRSVRHPEFSDRVIAVAGGTLVDFAFYYAISRMRSRAVWIPTPVLAKLLEPENRLSIDATWHFVNELSSLAIGSGHRDSGLNIASTTLTSEQLNQVTVRLSETAGRNIDPCEIVAPTQAIPSHPIRHYETNNVSVLRSFSVPDDGVIRLFETPLPQSFAEVNPSKHRWLTELSVRQYHLPRHWALGVRLIPDRNLTTQDVRISSAGPTYFCPSHFIFGGTSAESSVPRPSIRVPEPLELFEDIARARGVLCSTSDKGFYAENACKKFGGLASTSRFLRSDAGRSLVAAFLDKVKPKEGEHLKGVLIGDRRYFDLDSLATAIGSESEAAELLDRLASAAILYRGFILQCEYCRRADWFPLLDLTDAFTCKRCHREQVFTRQHWRYPNQPHLYYQLDELVYLGLEHNMQVPLLALDVLQRTSEDSFLYVHEITYREANGEARQLEVDLNCVIDGMLTIGEAKKDDRLGTNDREDAEAITRYIDLAKRIAAHQIVFATGGEQWHPSTVSRIREMFKNQRFKLILLSYQELYGKNGQTPT